MSGQKINLLLSGAGGSGTIALIRELGKDPLYNIVAMDADPYAVGLYTCGGSYLVPFIKTPEFRSTVEEIIARHGINVYIPLIDEELEVAYEIRKSFPGLHILAPTAEFCRLMLDKMQMFKAFRRHNLPVPDSFSMEDAGDIDFSTPKIIKPIVGRGSRGIQVVTRREQLEAYMVLTEYKRQDLFIQEFIQGVEYTVSAIADKKGRMLAVVPKRIIRKKGITQVAVTEKNEIIEGLCIDIQDRLKADGPFNVQLVMSGDRPYVFEVNPRFSTSVVLTLAAGINEVDILAKDRLDIPFTVPGYQSGMVMTRYYEQKYLEASEILCRK